MRTNRSKRNKSHSCECYEELLLQPWFLSSRVARAMRSLLPPDFRSRLRDYFNDYGCLRCGRQDVIYRSNGMCSPCLGLIIGRLERCADRRSSERLSRRCGASLASDTENAKRLLSGIRKPAKNKLKSAQIQYVRVTNPILGPG
jgi:hypothetical protein